MSLLYVKEYINYSSTIFMFNNKITKRYKNNFSAYFILYFTGNFCDIHLK